ncbi:ABC transporter permease subunit [Rhodococcus rhodnii]|uniref:ABC transmembrane type-1 domain-containing protein n=2 Tax=Rhodococcus rhodnii TaxID=38312 RepID=R7WRW1_9NOCA|nr:ABC transporter permease subunit [Rhodococcus rhodnii]EOM78020.1 hypothetical protein Rrhod_0694 [Rhodococcus rhodnii LMG 5362]TXG92077.1 ABC transporter permease subunit [Rhodococcus rhodnii]
MNAGGLAAEALRRYWVFPVILVAWWATVWVNDFNQIVMPYPQDVVVAIARDWAAYVDALVPTVALALGGLAIGSLLGGLGAIAVWSSRLLSGLLTPMAMILNSVPVVAMIPVLARVLGYGQGTVLAITAIVCVLPAFVFVGGRLSAPPAALGDVFSALGATTPTRLRHLLIPHAIPGFMVALRVSAPTAILAVLLAQYLMGAGGLGTMFATSVTYSRSQEAWGVAVVATLASMILFFTARSVADRVTARVG